MVCVIDEEVFRDSCRKFAEREFAPRWQRADREHRFPRDFYEAASKAGLIGVAAREAVGSGGLGCVEEAIVLEECAKVNPNLAVSTPHPERRVLDSPRFRHRRAEGHRPPHDRRRMPACHYAILDVSSAKLFATQTQLRAIVRELGMECP